MIQLDLQLIFQRFATICTCTVTDKHIHVESFRQVLQRHELSSALQKTWFTLQKTCHMTWVTGGESPL